MGWNKISFLKRRQNRRANASLAGGGVSRGEVEESAGRGEIHRGEVRMT